MCRGARFLTCAIARVAAGAAVLAQASVLAAAAHTQEATPPSDTAALAANVAALEAKVAYLSDRQQISDVFRRYARGVDRDDAALMQSAFWPDAQVNYGVSSVLRDAFVKRVIDGHIRRELESFVHLITNQTVDIAGDVAHVESYVTGIWRNKDDQSTTVGGGRYINRLDRRNGEWRIAVHEFLPDFWFEANSVFDSFFTEAGWPRSGCGIGTRDKRDPSYRRPLTPRSPKDVGVACAE